MCSKLRPISTRLTSSCRSDASIRRHLSHRLLFLPIQVVRIAAPARRFFTAGADQAWQSVDLGQIDGDQGFNFLDPTHDGYGLIVDIGEDFLYRFASYAGSFAPTRIRKLSGVQVQDVTRDPRYRDFLLQQTPGDGAGQRDEPNMGTKWVPCRLGCSKIHRWSAGRCVAGHAPSL